MVQIDRLHITNLVFCMFLVPCFMWNHFLSSQRMFRIDVWTISSTLSFEFSHSHNIPQTVLSWPLSLVSTDIFASHFMKGCARNLTQSDEPPPLWANVSDYIQRTLTLLANSGHRTLLIDVRSRSELVPVCMGPSWPWSYATALVLRTNVAIRMTRLYARHLHSYTIIHKWVRVGRTTGAVRTFIMHRVSGKYVPMCIVKHGIR